MKKLIVVMVILLLVALAIGVSSCATIHDDGWQKSLSIGSYDNGKNLMFIQCNSVGSFDLNKTLINLQSWLDVNKDKDVVSITFVEIDQCAKSEGFLIYYK